MRARLTLLGSQGSRLQIDLPALLTPELRERARADANAFIKQLRHAPYGPRTMRTAFQYRGHSLWWFTEIYLHKLRRIDAAIATALALEAAQEVHAPAAMRLETDDPVVHAVGAAASRLGHMTIECPGRPPAPRPPAVPSYLRAMTARLGRLRPSRPLARRGRPGVLAFVHSAFWAGSGPDPDSPRSEHYIGPVLDALGRRLGPGELLCVGVGPRRNFRARRWWDPIVPAAGGPAVIPIERLAPADALRPSEALWRARRTLQRALTGGEGIRSAAGYRGLDLWPVLRDDLIATALLQWPWAARAMDEAGAALDALEPSRIVTYAEAGGWGRALVIEAKRRKIPSAGLQHGFIYRHWLNYQHEPDELAPADGTPGFPHPDRTFVFDRLAGDHLERAGHLPASAVCVTGNPRLDELAARVAAVTPAARTAIRGRLGVLDEDAQRLVLLAAKHREVRAELPALRDVLAALPSVRLVVKPHPAETPDVYVELRGLANVTVLPAGADLAELLAAADLIVTMNSTVAVDGLLLGVPALVVGLPNNLSPFVDAEVMASGQTDLRGALEAVLYDRARRHQLAQAGRAFVSRAGLCADGRAADRTAAGILELRRSAP